MSIIKDFVAKIAIGIHGIALLEMTETLSDLNSIYATNEKNNNLILEDIANIGIEEWAEYALTDIPSVPGIYNFRGSALFSEDDVEYSTTCDGI